MAGNPSYPSWEDLMGGVHSVIESSKKHTNIDWNATFWLMIAIVTVIVFAIVKTTTKTRNNRQTRSFVRAMDKRIKNTANDSNDSNDQRTLLHVLNPVASADAELTKDPDASEVTAKGLHELTAVAEQATVAPVVDREEEVSTFSDYQKAFSTEREYHAIEAKYGTQAFFENDQVRTSLQESGKTLDEFLESNYIPLDYVDSLGPSVNLERTEFTYEGDDSEYLMLVREALQTVPNVTTSDACIVMKEILSARTEAYKLGRSIEIPDDQYKQLMMWTTRGGQAAELAKTILSRR